MNCQQIDKYIWDYCDNSLSPNIQARIEKHLQCCEHCRNKVELTMMENEALKAPGAMPPLGDDFAANVILALKASPTSSPAKPSAAGSRWSWLQLNRFSMGSLVAAVILVILVVPAAFDSQLLSVKQDILDPAGGASRQQVALHKDAPKGLEEEQSRTSPHELQAQEESRQQTAPSKPSATNGVPDKDSFCFVLPETDDNIVQDSSGFVRTLSEKSRESCSSINPARGYEIWSLAPSNIPVDYELQHISSSGQQLVFDYLNTSSGSSIKLVITPCDDSGVNDTVTATESAPEQKPASEEDAPVVENLTCGSSAAVNSYESILTYRSGTYHLLLIGALPLEELAEIGTVIQLEEVEVNDSHR